jgi:transcriptional regulator with XRE-family HTH domain
MSTRRRDPATEWVDVDGRDVGKRIVQARRRVGMTGRELADALDVSERSLRDYESGATIPWKHFARLETITGRSLEWFLHGREPRDRAAEKAAEQHRQVMRMMQALADSLRDLRVDVQRLQERDRRRASR